MPVFDYALAPVRQLLGGVFCVHIETLYILSLDGRVYFKLISIQIHIEFVCVCLLGSWKKRLGRNAVITIIITMHKSAAEYERRFHYLYYNPTVYETLAPNYEFSSKHKVSTQVQ